MNNANDQPNHLNHPVPFLDKVSSTDIFNISSDIIPSAIYVVLISFVLGMTRSVCDQSFLLILRFFFFIYLGYIIKGLYLTGLIQFDKANASYAKFSLLTLSTAVTLTYYIATGLAYWIFTHSPDTCFVTSIFLTSLLFFLLMIGVINLSKQILNVLMIFLCFPILIYYFLSDPRSFYSNFGIDPEIVRNLPTVQAEKRHCSCCAICTEDIKEGDEIMVLKCPGCHFFHAPCIKEWLVQKVVCPMCRNDNII